MPRDKEAETRSTWSGFERLVVFRLDDAKDRLARIEGQVSKMETELKAVEIKAGVFGLLAGLIPAAIIIIVSVFSSGCAVVPSSASASSSLVDGAVNSMNAAAPGNSNLDVLVYVGGISMLGGIIALVITRGRFGFLALGIGVGLVLLNAMVARFATWVFLPILIATGAISLAYGFQVVRQALQFRRGHGNDQ